VENRKHLIDAFATGTAGYTGLHRHTEVFNTTKVSIQYGVALGNRSTKPCYGLSEVEERDSDPNIFRA
jgi:hypothetical protein